MRRYIPAIVVAGLFVLGIIGCVCYAIHADANCPVVQPSAEQTESDTHTSDNEAKHPRWLTKAFCEAKLADIALAYFAYGLIIVTGYLAWATLKLWTATTRLIGHGLEQSLSGLTKKEIPFARK